MYQAQTSIDIDAPAARVWEVLTDFSRYPEWTGWKGEISGKAEKGAVLTVKARPRPGKLKITFFRIIRVEHERELRWSAWYAPFGLLSGQRYWVLERLSGGKTRVIQGEAFFGLLVPFIRGMIERKGTDAYRGMCEGLKAQAEKLNP